MDEVGAVGLDLSFVSHVNLMEPLLDRALEEQVQAGRGGALVLKYRPCIPTACTRTLRNAPLARLLTKAPIIIIIKGHSLRRACLQPATNTQNSKPRPPTTNAKDN